MFRKKIHLHSALSLSQKPNNVFDEEFWNSYIDGLSKLRKNDSKVLAPNGKKYHSMSSAVQTLKKYFEALKMKVPSTSQIIAALKSPFSQGDIIRAFHLIRYFQLCARGFFLTNSAIDKFQMQIVYSGAENWENVMCYFDSLLFAMFIRLESFEPMLFSTAKSENQLVDSLQSLLRLYVSLLRSGNLITTDITMRICEVLYKLGFEESLSYKQQDAAALFQFLTEALSMPMLTFKIDIQHGGKFNKKDDEKYTKERILFVSIPEDDIDQAPLDITKFDEKSSDKDSTKSSDTKAGSEIEGVLLEECLEDYFSNSISVKRELERRATLESLRRNSSVGGDNSDSLLSMQNSSVDLSSARKGIPLGEIEIIDENKDSSYPSHQKGPPSGDDKNSISVTTRERSSTLSIWSLNNGELSHPKREVSLPAWMFLRLLPFYTDDNNYNIAKTSKEFIQRRPVLPICLKRYSFNHSNAKADKSEKKVIIPPFIDLPNFVSDEDNETSSGNFRLILESAVCHRGTTITSGHFISVVRKSTSCPLSSEEADKSVWYLYDDMKKPEKIIEKPFKKIFDEEWPYLLFYRLEPTDDKLSKPDIPENSTQQDEIVISSTQQPRSIIKQEGSKEKFWGEATETLVEMDKINSEPRLSIPAAVSRKVSQVSTTSSNPIPEISPLDSRFVDIRDKYFWYCLHSGLDYYKEIPSINPKTFSEPSIMFQNENGISDSSTVSSIHRLGSTGEAFSLDAEDLFSRLSLSPEKKKKGSFSDNDPSGERAPLFNVNPPTNEDEDKFNKKQISKLNKKSHTKRIRRKREEYRKEKCMIM